MPVYLFATLDTKGAEAQFVRSQLEALGVECVLINTGCLGEPTVPCDVSSGELFAQIGCSLADLRQRSHRNEAIAAAASAAAQWILDEQSRGSVCGVLSLGGSAGTTIGTAAMRSLPIGIPKVMVSTLAAGQTRPYVGSKDILMLNAVVDIAGMNRISRSILSQAARAMAGMVLNPAPPEEGNDRPLIAATMFGVTTPCVEVARQRLEASGYEVLVFHATGIGGQTMESLIEEGLIAGVLDITTTELADELVGGTLSAGPDRLSMAGRKGVPQVISVGALDMVNFGPRATVPEKFADRKFHQHNATVTLMRTTEEENFRLGSEIAGLANASQGPVSIMFPWRGVSAIDQAGQPFDDPAARQALYEGLLQVEPPVLLQEFDEHINSPVFALAAAEELLRLMKSVDSR